MKVFFLTVALSLFTASAHAQYSSSGDNFKETATLWGGATLAPTAAALALHSCAFGKEDLMGIDCMIGSTYLPTAVATTIALVVHANKEEVQAHESDVLGYLAGEEMSLSLEMFLKNIREENPVLNELKDEQLLVFLLALV